MQSQYIPNKDLEHIKSFLPDADKALVDILILTGYRVDDMLNSRDWQWSGDSISIEERKTGRVRTVVITDQLKNAVERFRELRRGKRSSLSFFVPTRGYRVGEKRKLHRTTLYRHFQQAVEKAGLSGRGYSIHSLRKVYAVNLLRRTGSLEAVQADLGHKYITTTFIYCRAAYELSDVS